jgi:two-component system CheB/CheR fusion protein
MLNVSDADNGDYRADASHHIVAILSEIEKGASSRSNQGTDEGKRLALLIARCRHVMESFAIACRTGGDTENLTVIVQSLAFQTFEGSASVDDFERLFLRRLEALARVQALLQSGNPGYLRTLIETELRAVLGGELTKAVRVGGPEIELHREDIAMLSLAIHELAEGALRDRADQERMHVFISWAVRESAVERRLTIRWLTFGLRPSGNPPISDFGCELIEWGLPYALDASVRLEASESRLSCEIDMPLL